MIGGWSCHFEGFFFFWGQWWLWDKKNTKKQTRKKKKKKKRDKPAFLLLSPVERSKEKPHWERDMCNVLYWVYLFICSTCLIHIHIHIWHRSLFFLLLLLLCAPRCRVVLSWMDGLQEEFRKKERSWQHVNFFWQVSASQGRVFWSAVRKEREKKNKNKKVKLFFFLFEFFFDKLSN